VAGRSRLLQVAAQVRARGGLVAFDNNYRPRLWASVEEARAAFTAATEAATLALMTLDDEQALWGTTDAEAQLQRTLALPCPEVVVKRGALPTVVRCAGQPAVQVPTEPVPSVVDTTAAGDSFAGAYIAFRLGGGTALESAATGNRMAARVVQHRGAVIGLSAMADLMAR
jgi:2-dehydro-3-deoxygluconokinase